jgi:hypothetical protein
VPSGLFLLDALCTAMKGKLRFRSLKRRFALRLLEIAGVIVRLDHVASFIVNANQAATRPAAKLA